MVLYIQEPVDSEGLFVHLYVIIGFLWSSFLFWNLMHGWLKPCIISKGLCSGIHQLTPLILQTCNVTTSMAMWFIQKACKLPRFRICPVLLFCSCRSIMTVSFRVLSSTNSTCQAGSDILFNSWYSMQIKKLSLKSHTDSLILIFIWR